MAKLQDDGSVIHDRRKDFWVCVQIQAFAELWKRRDSLEDVQQEMQDGKSRNEYKVTFD